jgi:hypothetical protein
MQQCYVLTKIKDLSYLIYLKPLIWKIGLATLAIAIFIAIFSLKFDLGGHGKFSVISDH